LTRPATADASGVGFRVLAIELGQGLVASEASDGVDGDTLAAKAVL
jgi:hypothetical protein